MAKSKEWGRRSIFRRRPSGPSKETRSRLGAIPQPGRLGIFHSCLQETRSRLGAIPQPAGWGSFTFVYRKRGVGSPQSPNRQVGVLSRQPTSRQPDLAPHPPTGRLGIFHASLGIRDPPPRNDLTIAVVTLPHVPAYADGCHSVSTSACISALVWCFPIQSWLLFINEKAHS
jgi:hypothetical protein